MSRQKRRHGSPSTGSVVGTVLSVMFFVGVGVAVVILRAERRAERREAMFGSDDRGSRNDYNPGLWDPAAPPVAPAVPNPPPATPFPQNPPAPAAAPAAPPRLEPKALAPGISQTEPAAGGFAGIGYREYRDDGALLTGFEVGYGKFFDGVHIGYLRPVWLTAKGEEWGTAYGRSLSATAVVKAKPGYAVGGIAVGGGGGLDGFALTFMRIGTKRLDPADAYTSEWYGNPGHRPGGDLRRGDGPFVVGIHGKRFEDKGGKNFDDAGGIGSLGLTLWVKE